ncbi:MAG TPA: GNAT family N-acetyltransferase [Ideonella sp.]|nr:GNAT family N-acetyltransferase [Ideonella sp.]
MSNSTLPFRFEPYTADHEPAWNDFVARSPNATFLFDRGFMGYHADRFADASLLIHQGEHLVALLPAHRVGSQLISHGGLTYGGLLLGKHGGAVTVLHLLQALCEHLRAEGVTSLDYKTIPAIYHQRPCEEDRYALWRCGAELVRRDLISAISPQQSAQKARRRITKVKRCTPGLVIAEDDAWGEYWALLAAQLQSRHGCDPTHSEAELRLLAGRFPQQIKLLAARLDGSMVAGLVLFDTPNVLHAQYMAANAVAYQISAHRQVIETAVLQAQEQQKWFDFGNSNEDQGRVLNEGLVFFKEGFGATSTVQDFYRLNLGPH